MYPGESTDRPFRQEIEEENLEREFIAQTLYNCNFEDILKND